MIASLLLSLSFVAAPPIALTIKETLERVEKYDPSARASAYDLLRAEIALRRAQWNQISGSLGLNAQYSATKSGVLSSVALPDGTATFFDRFSANLLAQLTYPIYAGGSISGAIDGARFRRDATSDDRRIAVRDLKRAALVSYAQLIAANEQLAISTRSLERSHLLVDLAQKRKTSGMSTDADVARARLNELRQAEDL